MRCSRMVNFEGIEPAVLVHALYNGTRPLGMGVFQNINGLTLEQVRAEMSEPHDRGDFGIPVMDLPNKSGGKIDFDYYHGRPLKIRLDLEKHEFDERLYDRDAGKGAAARIVAELRVNMK